MGFAVGGVDEDGATGLFVVVGVAVLAAAGNGGAGAEDDGFDTVELAAPAAAAFATAVWCFVKTASVSCESLLAL